MSKPIQITIPTPCHENWQQMTPLEKGHFCASCQKAVTDFTAMTDNELAATIGKNKDGCGMFLSTQLDRKLITMKKAGNFWAASGVALISFMSAGVNNAYAQEIIKTEQCEIKPGETVPGQTPTLPPGYINGYVHNTQFFYLSGVTVKVKGTDKMVKTGRHGNFTIEAKPGDILELSCRRMVTTEIVVEEGRTEYNKTMLYNRKKKNIYRSMGRYF